MPKIISIANKIDLRIYAVFISIILSVVALSHHEPINYDGIFYLSVAGIYLKSGFAAAAAIYRWPFYILLVAWVSQLLHISLLYAAYLINTALITVIVVTFITLLKELNASRAIQIAGAAIILIYPQLNDYRDYVMRDFGYWAFSLIALWQLLRFAKTAYWRNAILWNITMLIATLFRLEGGAIVMLAPLSLLFIRDNSWLDRVNKTLKIYFIPLTLIVLIFIWHLNHAPQNHLGRLTELFNQFKNGWLLSKHAIQHEIALISHRILPSASKHDVIIFFAGGAIILFLGTIISALTLLYTLFIIHVWTKKIFVTEPNNKVILYGFIAVNLLVPLVFFSQQLYLSERYLMAFCLPLLLLVPYSLQNIAHRRRLFSIVIILLLASLASSIIRLGPSKTYITNAGLWLQQSTPVTATVYSNNMQVLFYAERTPINLNYYYDDSQPLQTINTKAWQNFDYLALRVNREFNNKHDQIITAIGKPPIKIFSNKRGDSIFIFQLKPTP